MMPTAFLRVSVRKTSSIWCRIHTVRLIVVALAQLSLNGRVAICSVITSIQGPTRAEAIRPVFFSLACINNALASMGRRSLSELPRFFPILTLSISTIRLSSSCTLFASASRFAPVKAMSLNRSSKEDLSFWARRIFCWSARLPASRMPILWSASVSIVSRCCVAGLTTMIWLEFTFERFLFGSLL